MDFNEKQAARSKWRLSQQQKNVHGGRSRAKSHPQHATQLLGGTDDLETNINRYILSDEEEQTNEGLVRQSEGGDLGQLLAETEQFYSQAHFRYRSFIDTIDTQPPPVDISAFEKGENLSIGGAGDLLDDLLAATSAAHGQAGATRSAAAKASSVRGKKESLQEWLDGI
eukprot:gene5860-6101_t